jgi:hypothetical protein
MGLAGRSPATGAPDGEVARPAPRSDAARLPTPAAAAPNAFPREASGTPPSRSEDTDPAGSPTAVGRSAAGRLTVARSPPRSGDPCLGEGPDAWNPSRRSDSGAASPPAERPPVPPGSVDPPPESAPGRPEPSLRSPSWSWSRFCSPLVGCRSSSSCSLDDPGDEGSWSGVMSMCHRTLSGGSAPQIGSSRDSAGSCLGAVSRNGHSRD